MKKRMFCFIIVILLVFFTAGPAFAADPEDNNDATDDSDINVENLISNLNGYGSAFGTGSGSPQLALAMLQMELAKTNKESALSGIKEIEKMQAEKKEVADYLETARARRKEAAGTQAKTEMPADMAQYMDAKNISYRHTGNDLFLTKDDWDYTIASLTNYLDRLGSNIQTQMVQLQDYMGQYNSYMQGANTAISQSNQVLAGLARGQSMYGDSEVGLAVTGLVVGLVLGCLVTLAVQKARGIKDKA